MISKETWERFSGCNVAFNCPTQEIYDKLMVELEKRGYYWCDGEVPTDGNEWVRYREKFCIDNTDAHGLTIGSIEFCDNVVVIQEKDFNDPSVSIAEPIEFPQPPQELISILRALAICVLIEKTHGVHLNLDELYDKREEYLEKWTSEFEVHL